MFSHSHALCISQLQQRLMITCWLLAGIVVQQLVEFYIIIICRKKTILCWLFSIGVYGMIWIINELTFSHALHHSRTSSTTPVQYTANQPQKCTNDSNAHAESRPAAVLALITIVPSSSMHRSMPICWMRKTQLRTSIVCNSSIQIEMNDNDQFLTHGLVPPPWAWPTHFPSSFSITMSECVAPL